MHRSTLGSDDEEDEEGDKGETEVELNEDVGGVEVVEPDRSPELPLSDGEFVLSFEKLTVVSCRNRWIPYTDPPSQQA